MSDAKTINDGGPAFPRPASIDPRQGDMPDGNRYVDPEDGMTLRDWFAGQALSSLLSCEPFQEQLALALKENNPEIRPEQERSETARIMARRSFIIADAMLLARGGA